MNIIAGTDRDGFLARRGAPLRPPLLSLSFDNRRILHAVNPAMELDARLMAVIDEGKGLPCDDRLESEPLAVVDQVKPNVWTVLSFYRKGYVSDGAEVSELTVALVVRPDSLTRGQAVQAVENMAAVLAGYDERFNDLAIEITQGFAQPAIYEAPRPTGAADQTQSTD